MKRGPERLALERFDHALDDDRSGMADALPEELVGIAVVPAKALHLDLDVVAVQDTHVDVRVSVFVPQVDVDVEVAEFVDFHEHPVDGVEARDASKRGNSFPVTSVVEALVINPEHTTSSGVVVVSSGHSYCRMSTDFTTAVYNVVGNIPKGQTMTYKEVALAAGRPKAYRAVGNILNKNFDPAIPCHRVIRSNGQAGGYNRGAETKMKRLRQEGAPV